MLNFKYIKMKLLTRDEYHKQKWKTVFWFDDCPFCKSEEQIGHTIWKWKYWYIIHNQSPYSWNDRHIMAVPYEHKVYSVELSNEEILELKGINNFVRDFFAWENYFSATRESMANRSVEHLHIHYIPWKLQWKYIRKMLEWQWFPIKEDLKI